MQDYSPSSQPITLQMQPGFFSETGDRDALGRWKTGDRVRFKNGLPEKMGGWEDAGVMNAGVTFGVGYVGNVLLAHLDGTNGSVAFIDESPANNTLSANGTAALSTSNPKFGPSALLPGTGYMSAATIVPNSALDVAPSSFTIEFWLYSPDVTTLSGVMEYGTFLSGGGLRAYLNSGSLEVQAGFFHGYGDLTKTVSANTWMHVAIVRDGTTGRVFVNGVQGVPQANWTGAFNFSGACRFGGNISFGSIASGGMVDEIRVTKGVARYTSNFTPPTAPFADEPPPATLVATLGVDRREHEWTSLDGQPWIAQGTSNKLYVINRGLRYDITPIRRSVSLTDPFTTTSGSAVVLVTDVGHGAETGDYVRLGATNSVGGLTITGEFQVTVLNGSQYQITFTSPASGNATGGGPTLAEYDINSGGVDAEIAHGWGTCTYGKGTWGTRRGNCSAIVLGPRLWSLDNFGEDLLASPRGGALYWWDRSLGPSSRAVLVETAPITIERMLVSPSGDQVIALGAFDSVAGSPDKMFVRTSALGTFADWDIPLDPDIDSTIFEERLTHGSRILTGFKTNGGVLVETDKASYLMRADATNIYVIGDPVATENTACGPNAGFDVNGTAYWMAEDKIMSFDGVQQEIPCDVWGFVFDNEAATPGFNRGQRDKVYGYYNKRGDEVTFLYPSRDSTENDRYLCLNRTLRVWYYGSMQRTAMSTGGIAYSLPYGSSPDGTLFLHEGVPDAAGALLGEFIESWDMQIGEGLQATHLALYIPDFKRWTGTMRMTLKAKDRPQQTTPTYSSVYDMPDDTEEQGVHFGARMIAVRFESIDLGATWRMAPGSFYGQPDASR